MFVSTEHNQLSLSLKSDIIQIHPCHLLHRDSTRPPCTYTTLRLVSHQSFECCVCMSTFHSEFKHVPAAQGHPLNVLCCFCWKCVKSRGQVCEQIESVISFPLFHCQRPELIDPETCCIRWALQWSHSNTRHASYCTGVYRFGV